MNIYQIFLDDLKKEILKNQNKLNIKNLNDFKGIVVESPPENFNCDLSTNVGLILGRINKLNPIDLSKNIKSLILDGNKKIKSVNIAGPGFININIDDSYIQKIIIKIFENKNKFGSLNTKKNYNIEFVSANPTGPMHVGHCRGAIFGDVLANLLRFNGNKITKEYYINDYGNQIYNFTKSVYLRIREIQFKEKFVNSENLYPGEYVKEIAKKIINEEDIKYDDFDKHFSILSEKSLRYSMEMIQLDLLKLGIKHDKFISEAHLVKNKLVDKAVNILKKNDQVTEGYLEPPKGEDNKNWVKTKRLIFKSTIFGDDSDRALQKNDGSWTYFANDVAYHMDKISRDYNYLINILGADHTGYIKRITAAVKALSNDKVKLNCKVCQLVKLYKNGQPYKMSKRAGDFISASDLLKEVNKDSIRFMMLNRSNDVELDFDFDKVLEKTKDNPVFYVQYCFARINSIFRTLKINLDDPTQLDVKNFKLNEYEVKILRKIFEWPKIIEVASNKLEPHRIPFYLYDLATLFHSYWSKGNEIQDLRFIKDNQIKSLNTLSIIKLTSVVIKNGMSILGVSLPEKM